MSDSESRRRHDLECLRLASNLMQLATDALDPALKAHCVRMAKMWSDQADQMPPDDIAVHSASHSEA